MRDITAKVTKHFRALKRALKTEQRAHRTVLTVRRRVLRSITAAGGAADAPSRSSSRKKRTYKPRKPRVNRKEK